MAVAVASAAVPTLAISSVTYSAISLVVAVVAAVNHALAKAQTFVTI